MKKLFAAVVVCLSLPGLATAGIYKCTDGNGRAVFSQSPCGADAVEVVIRDRRVGGSSPGDRPSVDYAALSRQINKRTRISALKRDIRALQLEKEGLRQERDARISKERGAVLWRDPENLALSNLWQQNVRAEYASRIAVVDERLAAARSKLAALQE